MPRCSWALPDMLNGWLRADFPSRPPSAPAPSFNRAAANETNSRSMHISAGHRYAVTLRGRSNTSAELILKSHSGKAGPWFTSFKQNDVVWIPIYEFIIEQIRRRRRRRRRRRASAIYRCWYRLGMKLCWMEVNRRISSFSSTPSVCVCVSFWIVKQVWMKQKMEEEDGMEKEERIMKWIGWQPPLIRWWRLPSPTSSSSI